MKKLSGVFAPIPTPFDRDGALDTDRLRAALTRWSATPLSGLVVLGSNGEAVLIDELEFDRVVVAAREHVPEDRWFIVGTGRESTSATVHATRRAADLGADAVLVRTPGFFKSQMTSDAFVRHYTAIADASPVPVLLYNFTALTGVNLQPAAVARLAVHPNIIGMKESGTDIVQISELVSSTPEDFRVLAGTTSAFYSALGVGCAGGVLAPACVLPEACVRLFELTIAGRHDAALALQRQLMPIAQLLGPVYGIPGLKAALAVVGYDVGFPRAPLSALSDEGIQALRAAIAEFERAAGSREATMSVR